MKLLWVAADKAGSRLIRWGLDSDCSHFAVCFDEGEHGDPSSGIAFHSYAHGTQVLMLRDFLKAYTVVHALEPNRALTLADEEAVYQAILQAESGRRYDYPALLWFAWRGLLAKIGWRRVDGVNRWQDPQARLCTGIAPSVFNALGVRFPGVDAELLPPHELYRLACDTGSFTTCSGWISAANLV